MKHPIFVDGEIYHVFNRSIEKQPIFYKVRNLVRAKLALDYYQFDQSHTRLSYALKMPKNQREAFLERLHTNSERRADILSYCFMPNHFHFLLKQNHKNGVARFVADFTNSYTRYYNTQNKKRIGPIFQGIFKAVRIENEEQLLHVSRYIHLNPLVSYLVDKPEDYLWSSLAEYLFKDKAEICQTELILGLFKSRRSYMQFILDQVDYSRTLEKIKHLILEEV